MAGPDIGSGTAAAAPGRPVGGRVSSACAQANLFGMLVGHGDLAEVQAVGRRFLLELRDLNIAHGWSDHSASWLDRCGSVERPVRLVGWADALRLARGLRRQPKSSVRVTRRSRVRAKAHPPPIAIVRWPKVPR